MALAEAGPQLIGAFMLGQHPLASREAGDMQCGLRNPGAVEALRCLIRQPLGALWERSGGPRRACLGVSKCRNDDSTSWIWVAAPSEQVYSCQVRRGFSEVVSLRSLCACPERSAIRDGSDSSARGRAEAPAPWDRSQKQRPQNARQMALAGPRGSEVLGGGLGGCLTVPGDSWRPLAVPPPPPRGPLGGSQRFWRCRRPSEAGGLGGPRVLR